MKNSLNLIDRKLNIATAKSEYKRIKLFIVALLLGLAVMSFDFFLVKDTTSFFKTQNSKYYIVLWFLFFLLYEGFAFLLARKYLTKKMLLPDFLKMGNVAIEAALPGVLIFTLCFTEKSVIFLDSPMIFFSFIIIVVSALNLDFRLSLITGIVSSGSYFCITLWAIHTFDTNNEVLNFPPILYIARSLFMFMSSLGTFFVAKEIRNTLKQLVNVTNKKNEIESLFGQQVSKKVVDTLMTDNYGSEKREVSVLFMDIRSFSSFAEQNLPKNVIKYQNDIFSPIIRIINKHNGITNQILGDGIMATFGAPLKDENHAQNALAAGYAILDEVKRLYTTKVIHETRIGIGLHTGKVVMGNIGNEMRKQFSISGTAVIIAARLEELNKKYGTQFLISQQFYDKVNTDEHSFEVVDELQLRNIEHKVKVYKVA